VIDRYIKAERFLNYLLIFLLPTQLALHFWPPFAFVFGIRVNYLAPTIYATDVLFFLLFVPWAIKTRSRLWTWIKKNAVYIGFFLVFASTNIFFSISPLPTLYEWAKVTEFGLFAFYVWVRREVFGSGSAQTSLFLSLTIFSIIGVVQFLEGKTIGGIMYYLGERSFNLSTPGIALISIGGRIFLRAYSTLPHPNALAGFLAVGTLMLSGVYIKKVFSVKTIGLLIILAALILTFSLAAFVAAVFCLVLYLIMTKLTAGKNMVSVLVLLFFVLSLFLPGISKYLLSLQINFNQSIGQRLDLAVISGNVISSRFFIGTGLNTFVINEAEGIVTNSHLWLLQPVHNIYLLAMSEAGIGGVLLLYILFSKMINGALIHERTGLFLAILFIMVTGLFDHYWLTLQQNSLLLAFLAGNSFSAKS
jgi:hypothetical protein